MVTYKIPYEFEPREYQKDVMNMYLGDTYKRGVVIWPRRNGKDLIGWQGLIANAFKRVGLYYYIAPYYKQVREIIWEGFTKEGKRFLDYIPEPLVKHRNKLDMQVDLINGSKIKLQGSDNIDRIVGANPCYCQFTEFSLQKPEAWDYLRPVLAENNGKAFFNGTPRGFNHLYDIYQKAQREDDWFVDFKTRDDTGYPTLEAIDADRRSGMSKELIQQEYYCSFFSASEGAYYSDQMQQLRKERHIRQVPYDPRLRVHTFWDIGRRDATAIWFAQFVGRDVRLIDYYENTFKGLPHYAAELQRKPYVYGYHFAPWDIEVHEWTSNTTRKDIAAELGIDFETVDRASVDEGIELVRMLLPRCYFDTSKTEQGVQALSHYRAGIDKRTKAINNIPAKSWANHGADAFRMLAMALEQYGDLVSYNDGALDEYEKVNVIRSVDIAHNSGMSHTSNHLYNSNGSVAA